jgi:hypothetical protein
VTLAPGSGVAARALQISMSRLLVLVGAIALLAFIGGAVWLRRADEPTHQPAAAVRLDD